VSAESRRVVRLEIPIETEEELAALEGALLAARASELSQMRRRGDRQAFGYGSDSARETMSDEVDRAERRWTMLDRLLTALKVSPSGSQDAD
jgi:hypothetical protein